MEYTLKRGGLTAVVTDQGGELISLRDAAGLEYIWQGDPASWTGRSPILFPIVGSLLDETIRIGGAPFHMKQHGFARRSAFTLEERDRYLFCGRARQLWHSIPFPSISGSATS